MKLFDRRLLKLGLGSGLVLGMVTIVGVELIEVGKLIKMWQAGEEMLGLGLGVVFVVMNAEDMRMWSKYQTITRYVSFLLTVLVIWGMWMVMMVQLSGGEGKGWEEINTYSGSKGLMIRAVVKYVAEALKLIGLGLLPVMGYRLLTKEQKHTRTKE